MLELTTWHSSSTRSPQRQRFPPAFSTVAGAHGISSRSRWIVLHSSVVSPRWEGSFCLHATTATYPNGGSVAYMLLHRPT